MMRRLMTDWANADKRRPGTDSETGEGAGKVCYAGAVMIEPETILLDDGLPYVEAYDRDVIHGENFPFELVYDPALPGVRQALTVGLRQRVDKSYKSGFSMVPGGDAQSPFIRGRVSGLRDALRHLDLPILGRRVLEIGSANCDNVIAFMQSGAEVVACDPNPATRAMGLRHGFATIDDYYRPGMVAAEFDLIVLSEILEHVADPGGFLSGLAAALAPGGSLFIKSPNAETQLRAGDPGMMAHMHWHYFTPASMQCVLERAGFAGFRHIDSGTENAFFARVEPGSGIDAAAARGMGELQSLARAYASKVAALIAALDARLRMINSGRVALVGATRTGIYLLDRLTPPGGIDIEVFDKDTNKLGRLISKNGPRVQDQAALFETAEPPSEIWITAIGHAGPARAAIEAAAGAKGVTVPVMSVFEASDR